MSDVIDWAAHRIPVVEAIRDGAAHVSDDVGDPVIGPTTFDSVRYPYAEVLPESSTHQGGNEFEHLVRLNLYFERGRVREDHPGGQYLDHLATAMDATIHALGELADREVVVTYVPTNIEDFAGELDNTLLLLISVQLRVTTLADLSQTA